VGGLVCVFVWRRGVGSWAGCACDDVRYLRAGAALRVRLRRHFHVVVAVWVCVYVYSPTMRGQDDDVFV
jgi:hypothetical protein